MHVTPHTRLLLRANNLIFVILLLAAAVLLGWLTTRHSVQFDWTASARNTLSEASQTLLQRIDDPVRITAYAREDAIIRQRVNELVNRYQQKKSDIRLEFVNPDTVPDRVRELGITVDGELVVEYQGRSEHVQRHTEQELTNALQRIARAGERWLVFLEGHGERSLLGQANHDLGDFGGRLKSRGVRVQGLNLAESGAIPGNTSVLVIADPQVALLSGEVEIIRDYLATGGNLLWLTEPGADAGLAPLAKFLGIEFGRGTAVDPTTRIFGIGDPAYALVTTYPPHPLTRGFNLLTLYPRAGSLHVTAPENWDAQTLLSTSSRSWGESGDLAGEIRFDEGTDEPGPLDIGVVMTRQRAEPGAGDEGQMAGQQRVLVIGDGDFLSNAFLGNGGNLDLGLSMVNWLASDDSLVAIPARTAPDLSLELSSTASLALAIGILFGLPLCLLGAGGFIWFRRRRL